MYVWNEWGENEQEKSLRGFNTNTWNVNLKNIQLFIETGICQRAQAQAEAQA